MRCSNEFDPRSTSARWSLNIRIVGMLVKAHSLMSAFVQCCCRLHDSASPTPSRSRRLKRVGRNTGSRINSIFLAKTRRSHLSMRPSAVMHKSDRAAIPPSDSNRHRRGALDETQLWAIIALLPRVHRLEIVSGGRRPMSMQRRYTGTHARDFSSRSALLARRRSPDGGPAKGSAENGDRSRAINEHSVCGRNVIDALTRNR